MAKQASLPFCRRALLLVPAGARVLARVFSCRYPRCFITDRGITRAKKTVSMSALRNRMQGQRGVPDFLKNIHPATDRLGELNGELSKTLAGLLSSDPTAQSCLQTLASLVLSGGFTLKRGDQDVQLKPAFERHLREVRAF
eukprot:1303134-Prymnesium_polylepis.2